MLFVKLGGFFGGQRSFDFCQKICGVFLRLSQHQINSYSSSSGFSFEEEEGALEIEDDRPLPRMSSVVPSPSLYNLAMELQEEAGLSGSWEHDLQEQYVSEGSVLGTWDNSMKSVLCFGEDYSNYIRRKSELPSIDIINSDMIGLQVRRDRGRGQQTFFH